MSVGLALSLLSGALVAAAALSGCNNSSDSSNPENPIPDGGSLLGTDATIHLFKPDASLFSADAGMMCQEGACDGYIDRTRIQNGMAPCIQFKDQHARHLLTGLELEERKNHSTVSMKDLNADGLLDLCFFHPSSSSTCYLSQGGVFTEAQNFSSVLSSYKNVVWGDRYFLRMGQQDSDLVKNENGVFTPLLSPQGIHLLGDPGITGVFLGMDLLFATDNRLYFYRNLGNDHFSEVANDIGLRNAGNIAALPAADFDGDGDLDFYAASPSDRAKRLYVNHGDGTFTSSVSSTTGQFVLSDPGASVDAQWVLRQPGELPSLHVINWSDENNQDPGNILYCRNSRGSFEDCTDRMGLRAQSKNTKVAWGDILNNQTPSHVLGKFEEPSRFYYPLLNQNSNSVDHYEDITLPLNLSILGKTIFVGFLDYDRDGKQDLLAVMADGVVLLFKNQSEKVKVCPKT